MLDSLSVQVDLEGHQKDEKQFVFLVQRSAGVLMYFEGKVLDDVGNTFLVDRRFGRSRHRVVEELEELVQGGLVHHINVLHFGDEEIQDRASCGHGAELFSGRVDFNVGFGGDGQLFRNLGGRFLRRLQHSNERLVVHKRSLKSLINGLYFVFNC